LKLNAINANSTTNNIGQLPLLILLLCVKKEELVASHSVKIFLRFMWQMSFHENQPREPCKLLQTVAYTIPTNLAV
jgi:hypothetical protein